MWATGQIQGFSLCESYKYVKRADPRCPLMTGDAPTWGMALTHGDSGPLKRLGSSCDGRQWEHGLWVQGKVRVVGAVRPPVTAARCVCVCVHTAQRRSALGPARGHADVIPLQTDWHSEASASRSFPGRGSPSCQPTVLLHGPQAPCAGRAGSAVLVASVAP